MASSFSSAPTTSGTSRSPACCLDALSAASDARVVTVSSIEHKPGKIDFDDLGSERNYAPRTAYQRSKFANAVFGLELDRRLREAGLPIRSVLAHPGYSATNLQSSGPTGPMKALLAVGNRLLAQGAEQGALPQLYAATEPSVEGGSFIGPDGFQEFRGSPEGRRAGRPRSRRRHGAAAVAGLGGAHRRPLPLLSADLRL